MPCTKNFYIWTETENALIDVKIEKGELGAFVNTAILAHIKSIKANKTPRGEPKITSEIISEGITEAQARENEKEKEELKNTENTAREYEIFKMNQQKILIHAETIADYAHANAPDWRAQYEEMINLWTSPEIRELIKKHYKEKLVFLIQQDEEIKKYAEEKH